MNEKKSRFNQFLQRWLINTLAVLVTVVLLRGHIRYAETDDPIVADTIPADTPLKTLTFGDTRQNRLSAGGNAYLTANAMKSLSPFLGFALQGYPINVDGDEFD